MLAKSNRNSKTCECCDKIPLLKKDRYRKLWSELNWLIINNKIHPLITSKNRVLSRNQPNHGQKSNKKFKCLNNWIKVRHIFIPTEMLSQRIWSDDKFSSSHSCAHTFFMIKHNWIVIFWGQKLFFSSTLTIILRETSSLEGVLLRDLVLHF